MAEKGKRGFAAMDPEKQRQIASMGGKAAHQKGTAHEFTPEEAREAGRKGGQAAHQRGRAHVFTSEEARRAGRKGGQHSRARRAAARAAEQTPAPSAEQPGGAGLQAAPPEGLNPQGQGNGSQGDFAPPSHPPEETAESTERPASPAQIG
ncbi:MAG TPA: KGG domain-containing protein [Gemmataceae bacterium]|nr:KGG domain-containing protein [Gemmataceae bacterium]